MEPKGKKAIITGGANGIGRALTEALVAAGSSVGVLDFSRESIDKLRKDIPDIYCRICDIRDPVQVEKAIGDFYSEFGAIDILINNAGMIHSASLVGMDKGGISKYDPAIWDDVIATNLSGVFYMTSNVIQKMLMKRTAGLVINVSSVCAAGNAGQSAYSASKAGVNALTVVWAKELSPLGIRVAGIAPGFAKTETTLRSMGEKVLGEWSKKTPLRRMAEVREIIDGVMFIINNDFFNGRVLELDGGLRI